MKKSLLLSSLLATALASTMVTTGCTDVNRSQLSAYGTAHRITFYSATGQVIKQWETDGAVSNAPGSDGYEFKDKVSGKLVRVSGSVLVETL